MPFNGYGTNTQTLSVQISDEQRWCGRRVCAYDGTTVTLCDTRQPAGLSSARQSEAGVWLSVGKVSRLVLCDHRSRVGGVDCGV